MRQLGSLLLGSLLVLPLLAGCASESSQNESDVTAGPNLLFDGITSNELEVGLPTSYFYSDDPIPCGLAVGSGPSVTSVRFSGSTAKTNNLKLDLYAGARICRTIFFKAKDVVDDFGDYHIHLEVSDASTVTKPDADHTIIINTATGEFTAMLGYMRDRTSSKYVGIRIDTKVTLGPATNVSGAPHRIVKN